MTSKERKSEWPELVGKTEKEAREILLKEDKDLQVETHVMRPDLTFTCDFRPDRVRLVVDKAGMVQQPPRRE